ncbi:MAG: M20/M25/M40 family metallo-hydrolase [bacterium]|nr:M20/M25/M40 family metallo-hydrolase [bacterium]
MKKLIVLTLIISSLAYADVLLRVEVGDVPSLEQFRAGQNLPVYYWQGNAYVRADDVYAIDFRGFDYEEITRTPGDRVFVVIPGISGYSPEPYLESGDAGGNCTYYIVSAETAKSIPPGFSNSILTRPPEIRDDGVGRAFDGELDIDKARAVDMVDQNGLMDIVNHLSSYHSRYVGYPDNITACNWIEDEFGENFRCTTELDYFDADPPGEYGPFTVPNVLCTLPGITSPEEYVIVCAHLDSWAPECFTDPNAPAPGADDNATGVAAVMEAARILSHFAFDRSVIFAAWNAEEIGFVGSEHYISDAYDDGMNIYCGLNGDVLGYDPDELKDCVVIRDPNDNEFYQILGDNIEDYTTLEWEISYSGRSDQQSFWNYGYDATALYEGINDGNPTINSRHDTIDLLHPPFFEQVVRGFVATAFELAEPNGTPFIWIKRPGANGGKAGLRYEIGWFDVDIDDAFVDAEISLYYDTDNDGAGGTLIASGIAQNDDGNSGGYMWDVSSVPEGRYYVYGTIADGVNQPHTSVSEGTLLITRATPNIVAYPNPLRISDGNSQLKMTGLAAGDTVSLYNISGQKIYEGLARGGDWAWEIPGNVASGVYLYQVNSTVTGEMLQGKFAVIR